MLGTLPVAEVERETCLLSSECVKILDLDLEHHRHRSLGKQATGSVAQTQDNVGPWGSD